jgi:hypothetical protein
MNSPNVGDLFVELVFTTRSLNEETAPASWGVYPICVLANLKLGTGTTPTANHRPMAAPYAAKCFTQAATTSGLFKSSLICCDGAKTPLVAVSTRTTVTIMSLLLIIIVLAILFGGGGYYYGGVGYGGGGLVSILVLLLVLRLVGVI